LSGQKNGYRRRWVAGSEHVAKVLKTVPEAARAAVEDLLLGSTARPAPKAAIRKAVKSKVLAEKKPPAEARAQRQKRKSRAIVKASNGEFHSSREIDCLLADRAVTPPIQLGVSQRAEKNS
jgi:hypothetical protein